MRRGSSIKFAVAAIFGAAATVALGIAPACAQPATPTVRATPAPSIAPRGWHTLEPGLDYAEFTAPTPSIAGDSKVFAVRIDPARFQFELLSASALKLPQRLPIDAWTKQHRLVTATNAGMYEPNGDTVGYSRVGEVTLNANRKASYGAYLVIGPDDPKLPAAAILDPDCDDVAAMEKHYRIVLQSMRMRSCKGVNLWPKTPRVWSMSLVGIDNEDRVLFIHTRSPWDVHDFIEILPKLPLGLLRAMYLEGGPEASLSVAAGNITKTHVGSYETGYNENDNNVRVWDLPNILGVLRARGVTP